MKFERLYTKAGTPIQDQIKWKTCNAKINDKDGNSIFEMQNIEVPEHWSQTATNIIAQKYFRKAQVPQGSLDGKEELNIPSWLWSREADEGISTGSETSAKQVFHRLAGCWTYWGWKEGIFKLNINDYQDRILPNSLNDEEENAQIFYNELYYMLAMQIAAPNSPQWFNTGLHWAYGIKGSDNGQWYVDYEGDSQTPPGCIYPNTEGYKYPQPHACFIQPVSDDLVNPGGIMDLWTREVRLFKHGSGTGTNFSNIRAKGEPLSGGGKSSGLMSFLKIGDVAAGAVQSGGTTRRAAKMVCLDLDHPEIEDFINWKVREERKARSMSLGSALLSERDGEEIYSDNFEGEAINSVSGQNSNNSVRVTDNFLNHLDNNLEWSLTQRTNGKVVRTLFARDLWNQICFAAWNCADPGILYHDTINLWHTCKTDGQIEACNPCGEYQHLNNTACNLASLNLLTFISRDGIFDTRSFEHATRIWTVVLEISVYMASFPSKEIAEGSYNYRTLGLGYANLGGLLLRKNLGYDSDPGRNYAADITALMHGVAYSTSAEMADELGPFPRYEANIESMLNVIRKHQFHAYDISRTRTELSRFIWKWYEDLSRVKNGFRNAQVSLIAPTGTIALLMDCLTTGIEPFFSQQITKNLAGGGEMQFKNEVPESECAVGENCLRPMAHVLMVAAVQPFLSGAVSKTVNLPNSATVEDIDQIYREAHKLGLKAIAVYRDGSKMTQPMNTKTEDPNISTLPIKEYQEHINNAWEEANLELELTCKSNSRSPLPMKRKGYTQKLRVEDQVLYLRTGNYPDGSLGEIFVTLSREGSTVRSLMESFGKAISIGLQFGVPLQEFVDAFTHTKFEPSGIVQGHDRIKMCSSIIDLIFRDLAVEYLKQDDLAHIKPNGKLGDKVQIKTEDQPPQEYKYPFIYTPEMTPELQTLLTSEPNKNLDLCQACGEMAVMHVGTCTMCTNCYDSSGCG